MAKKNTVIRKASKKTLGKTVDSVSDYVDLMAQGVAEYFNQRYKIKKRVQDVKKTILQALYGLKKGFVATIVEALFLSTGLLALIAGIIIILNKMFAIEYVLLGYGLLVTLGVMMQMKLKV